MPAPAPNTIGNWLAPARFVLFAFVFLASAGLAAAFGQDWVHAIMAAFDIAAVLFLLSLISVFTKSEAKDMRQHAIENDANRVVLLAITGAVMIVILVAVASELRGDNEGGAKALILATLTIAWLFSNTVYALHYGHLWYLRAESGKGDAGGIDFPKTDQPDYWDFVYFAFTIGMTFQTSDVAITGRHIRKVVVFHSFAAFLFNLGVIAFTINVLGSSS